MPAPRNGLSNATLEDIGAVFFYVKSISMKFLHFALHSNRRKHCWIAMTRYKISITAIAF